MSDKKLDPRQTKFLENYLDPKSKTFSNALQSALSAGYSQEYAESITAQMPQWFEANVRRTGMLDKAEKNLFEILKMGDIKDKDLLRIKADISKFVASRLGKKFYSDRQEVTGKDGEPLDIKWQK